MTDNRPYIVLIRRKQGNLPAVPAGSFSLVLHSHTLRMWVFRPQHWGVQILARNGSCKADISAVSWMLEYEHVRDLAGQSSLQVHGTRLNGMWWTKYCLLRKMAMSSISSIPAKYRNCHDGHCHHCCWGWDAGLVSWRLMTVPVPFDTVLFKHGIEKTLMSSIAFVYQKMMSATFCWNRQCRPVCWIKQTSPPVLAGWNVRI